MSTTNLAPKYSLSRYWRYIFVPLVVVLIFIAWYVIFNLSPGQLTVGPLPSLPIPSTVPAAAAVVTKPPV